MVMKNLISWCENNNVQKPIKLEIGLVKVSSDRMTRYFRVKINGFDVTQMIANATEKKLSKAKTTDGCLIIKGCGMDMGFALQNSVSRRAEQLGFDIFHPSEYIYLGRIK